MGASAFHLSRLSLSFIDQICVSYGPMWGENINLWFLGPIKSPPHFSSLAPHPDQPEFTPVQDELEAMELWGSGIWSP